MIKFEHLTLSQRIAETIASQIVEGKLNPGERLIENELSDLFGTSRSPIREALYILESQGIVERIPRKGVLVKNYSKKEVFDLYYVVYNLTEIALKKGMETYTEEQLKALYDLIKKMEETIESREMKNCFLLIEQLHMKLFELPDNKVLEDLYQRVNMRWTTFRYLSLSHPDSLKRSIQEYKEIVISLEQKDFTRIPPILEKKKSRALSVLEKLVAE
ncbi:GntR family transcriptional regulator [Bacillus horti]|uniref:DNA-binding GntR family transcriptional regulator n=1 Tax=Caldalkalibacillus horti TaxID=77523 RepID=A0ABT9W6E5_9BACI|nr:GntR family transcriptional regulator [Bacillus horti]MDQ0168420.1 DNA-binding GntR family transcriptional regulator [Bacillus horti]